MVVLSTGTPLRLLSPALAPEPHTVGLHTPTVTYSEDQGIRKTEAPLAGLVDCRRVVNESKTFWNDHFNQRDLKIREAHLKVDKNASILITKTQYCKFSSVGPCRRPAHSYFTLVGTACLANDPQVLLTLTQKVQRSFASVPAPPSRLSQKVTIFISFSVHPSSVFFMQISIDIISHVPLHKSCKAHMLFSTRHFSLRSVS